MHSTSGRRVGLIVVIAGLLALNLYQAALLALPRPAVNQSGPVVSDVVKQRDRDQLIRDFHILSYSSLNWASSQWLGITTEQNPNDVWAIQELIVDVKPDYFVEAGTFKGGSAALWATILAQVNPDARVITIDIVDKAQDARKLQVVKDKVDFLVGSSTAPEIVAEVTRRVKGKRVMVMLDSDHSKDHVLGELKAYSPLVPVGSYLIVQDTNVNGRPVLPEFGPGPGEAVDEFLRDNRDFVVDRRPERFLFTMHPGGYLKRVR